MFHSRIIRTSLVLGVVLALVAAACSPSTDGEDAESTTTTTLSGEAGAEADPDADSTTSTTTVEAVAEMCRTLDLLSYAGVTAGPASQSLTRTDLSELSAAATVRYGDLLVSAPRESCQEHIPFADEIAYWLGF